MYKRAYVRFATTKFNLDSLDAQVHLTNNAIQKNYSIDADIQERFFKYYNKKTIIS